MFFIHNFVNKMHISEHIFTNRTNEKTKQK